MALLDGNVRDQNGAIVSGASVFIFETTGRLADLFDDLGQPLPNPVTTGEDGYFEAHVGAEGYYTLEYWWGARRRRIDANVIAGRSPVDQAVEAAAFAEAFSGPVYASQGAGEAATTEGQIFRVGNGDGPPETTTPYRRTSGGSVELAPLATTAALASTDPGKGAALVGDEAGGTVQDALDRYRNATKISSYLSNSQIADVLGRNTTTSDLTQELLDALADCSGAGTRCLLLDVPGSYRVTDVLMQSAETFGQQIIGLGVFSTELFIDHDNGPGLWLNRSGGRVSDLTLQASATRKVAAAGSGTGINCGLLFAAADEAGKSCAQMAVERVRVREHPHSGIVHCGLGIMSRYQQPLCQENGRNGIEFDSGQLLGYSNISYCGLITIQNGWLVENTGHGLKIGDPADAPGTPHLRFDVLNTEISGNARSAGTRISEDEVWLRGSQMTFDSCATGFGTSTVGGIRFAGQHLVIRNHRNVRNSHLVRLQPDHANTAGTYEFEYTRAVTADGVQVLNDAVDPLVVIEDYGGRTGLQYVRDVHLYTRGNRDNITTAFTPGGQRCTWDNAASMQIVRSTADQSVTSSTTLVAHDTLSIPLARAETVLFEAELRYTGSSTGDIKIAFSGPSNCTIRWGPRGSVYVAPDNTLTVKNGDVTESTSLAFGCDGSGGARIASICGRCTTGNAASDYGNLTLQFAQQNSDSTASTINANSTLRVVRTNANN